MVKRGSITFWFDEDLQENWYYDGPEQRGGQFKYSDVCMVGLLQPKAVFNLKYRQLEGFAASILSIMDLNLEVPCYTQVSRRAQQIEVQLSLAKSNGPLYIVFDSTGLKVYGDGEWKVRKHGISKRRTWRKLHLGVDEKTGMIHAQVLTENGKGDGDSQQFRDLLEQVESPVDRVSGDGAYDTYDIWSVLKEKNIERIIPPQENAIYWVDEYGELLDIGRNSVLEKIEQKGRKEWKQESGYHRRSLSETAMFRYKKIFGAELLSRKLKSQKTEAAVKVICLNKMTGIGMPVSKKIS
ncbi:MAG: IS5 family transposase [Saprospiraceae bacterium]|nr:IS5 family transposase [Saprospiraceae bacterium]